MSPWCNLPLELVLEIVLCSVVDSSVTSASWGASLLSISQAMHRCLVPFVYHTMRVTVHNEAAILIQIDNCNPNFAHVRTLHFRPDALQNRQAMEPWVVAHRVRAFVRIKRFQGPRFVLAHYARHANFAPTHVRVRPLNALSLLCEDMATSFAALTHLHLEYLSPIQLAPGHSLVCPPSLLRINLAPRAVFDLALLRRDILIILAAASQFLRLTVCLGHTRTSVRRPDDAWLALLHTWAVELRHTRLYIDMATDDFGVEDDALWGEGDRLASVAGDAVPSSGN